MNGFNKLKALSLCLTACVAAGAIAACVIRLRGDEHQAGPLTSAAVQSETSVTMPEQCCTVRYEQNEGFLECQRRWAERRRRFLGEMRHPSFDPESGPPDAEPLSPLPKDETRLHLGYPSIPAQSE